MNTFYFNTGVIPETVHNPSFAYDYHKKQGHVIRGTLLIPFDCDVPKDAVLLFLCSNPGLSESKQENVLVAKVHNSTMCSEYAYFRV